MSLLRRRMMMQREMKTDNLIDISKATLLSGKYTQDIEVDKSATYYFYSTAGWSVRITNTFGGSLDYFGNGIYDRWLEIDMSQYVDAKYATVTWLEDAEQTYFGKTYGGE